MSYHQAATLKLIKEVDSNSEDVGICNAEGYVDTNASDMQLLNYTPPPSVSVSGSPYSGHICTYSPSICWQYHLCSP